MVEMTKIKYEDRMWCSLLDENYRFSAQKTLFFFFCFAYSFDSLWDIPFNNY